MSIKKRELSVGPPPTNRGTHISAILGLFWVFTSAYLYGLDRLSSNISTALSLPVSNLFNNVQLDRLIPLGVSLFWLICIFGSAALCGRLLVRLFKLEDMSFHEESLFSLGLGLGFYSLLMLGLGLCGAFTPALIRAVFAGLGALVIAVHVYRPIPKDALISLLPKSGKTGVTSALAGSMIAALIVINFIGALGPPIFYDTLVYHLALPKLYLLNHEIFSTPHNVFSGFPSGMGMLCSLGMALGGEDVAKLIPWGISLALLFSIAAWAHRFADARTGLFASLLFYSCPIVANQIWFSLAELNWAFFSILAIFSLAIGLESPESLGRRWFALTGIFVGLAIGVKYNAAALLAIIPPILIWKKLSAQKDGLKPIIIDSLFLMGVALLTASPWFLKNIFFYHNPVFPFFNELFTNASTSPDWRGLQMDAGRNLRDIFTWAGFLSLFSTLWSRTWEGTGIQTAGPALLFFIPWLFAEKWTARRGYSVLFLIFIFSWITWALSTQFPRFFIFSIPFLSILLATSLFSEKRTSAFQRAIPLAVILACIPNCFLIFNYWFRLGGWEVVLGQRSKSEYLTQGQPGYFTPYYAAADFINQKLPRNARILLLSESRGYHLERDFIATSYFASDPFAFQVNQSKSPEQLRDSIENDGITHILFNKAEFFRRDQAWQISSEGTLILNAFMAKYTHQIFRKVVASPPAPMKDRQWVEVYEIREGREKK